MISAAWEAEKGIRELKRLRREYNTPHLKVHTLKLFMDGTLKLHSGAMVTPYVETGEKGCNAMNLEEVVSLLKVLNEEGLDFHVHTVGEASSRLVLDAVEQVKKELGGRFPDQGRIRPSADSGYCGSDPLCAFGRDCELYALVAQR